MGNVTDAVFCSQVPLVIRFADSHGKTRRSSKSERNLAALPGGGMNGGSGHGMTGLGGSIGNGLVDIPTRMGGGSDSRDNSFRGGSQHHPGVVSPGSALISLIANNAAAAGGSAHGPGTLDIASMLLARQNAVTAAALLQQQQANSQSGDGSFRGGNHNPFHPGSVDSASSFGDGSFRGGSNSFGGNSGFGGALNMLQQQQAQSGPNTNAGGVGGLSQMFAGGMDIAGSPQGTPSTQGITFGTGPQIPSGPVSALDKSSRGSSVRGGNAFGPVSFFVFERFFLCSYGQLE
jgi:ELAV like protein 2/3/4